MSIIILTRFSAYSVSREVPYLMTRLWIMFRTLPAYVVFFFNTKPPFKASRICNAFFEVNPA